MITRLWNFVSRLEAFSCRFIHFFATRRRSKTRRLQQRLFAGEELELSQRLKKLARETGTNRHLHRHPICDFRAQNAALFAVGGSSQVSVPRHLRHAPRDGSRESAHMWYDGGDKFYCIKRKNKFSVGEVMVMLLSCRRRNGIAAGCPTCRAQIRILLQHKSCRSDGHDTFTLFAGMVTSTLASRGLNDGNQTQNPPVTENSAAHCRACVRWPIVPATNLAVRAGSTAAGNFYVQSIKIAVESQRRK